MNTKRLLPALCTVLAAVGLLHGSVMAGEVPIRGIGGSFVIGVKSLKEQRWETVVRQQYDYSCGSAALATLLTFHYQHPVAEQTVFQNMFESGDRETIRKQGFSLFDLKRYMDAQGYDADGFKLTLERWAKLGVPGVALTNINGYRHFVVVKGIRNGRVLLADPALGTINVPRETFERWWNGVGLLARAEARVARTGFNARRDWHTWSEAPLGTAIDRSTRQGLTILLPGTQLTVLR